MALIVDTSVVFASIDRSDRDYARCRALLEESSEALTLPSPVLPEIDYLVGRNVGRGVMVQLLRNIELGALQVVDLTAADYQRVAELVDRYADLGVGFVDAAVLAVTEGMGEPKLATLDHRHFSIMRPRHVDALQLLPA
ncbi:MAG: type II toxin-antitoxin system VapC family toxin [Actinomycetota bacterium]